MCELTRAISPPSQLLFWDIVLSADAIAVADLCSREILDLVDSAPWFSAVGRQQRLQDSLHQLSIIGYEKVRPEIEDDRFTDASPKPAAARSSRLTRSQATLLR